MADEATLTIRFRDESSTGGSSYGSTGPLPGPSVQPDYSQGVQGVYTSAGGVGGFVDRGQMWQQVVATPSFIPPAVSSTIPDMPTSVRVDDTAFVETYLQKIAEREARVDTMIRTEARPLKDILDEMRTYEFPKPPHSDDYLRSLSDNLNDEERIRRTSVEYNAELERQSEAERLQRIQDHRDEMAARMRQQQELDEVLRSAKYDLPKPPPLTREQILTESERIKPPIIDSEDEQDELNSQGVNNTLQSINSIAGRLGGPVGEAVSGIASPIISPVSSGLTEAAAGLGISSAALSTGMAVLGGVAAAGAVVAAGVSAGTYFQNQRVQETMTFSPDVALAVTEEAISRMHRSMETAKEYGPQIAASERLSTRVKESYREFNDWWEQNFTNFKDHWNLVWLAAREGMDAAVEEMRALKAASRGVDTIGSLAAMKTQEGFMDIIPSVPVVDWDGVLREDGRPSTKPLPPIDRINPYPFGFSGF